MTAIAVPSPQRRCRERRPARDLRPQRRRKSTLLKGVVGSLKPLSGSVALPMARRAISPICRKRPTSTAAFRLTCSMSSPSWIMGALRPVRLDRAPRIDESRKRHRRGRPRRLRAARHRHPFRRPAAAHAVRAPPASVDAAIILLDEPFTAMNSKTVSDLLDLVARWSREKRTVLAGLFMTRSSCVRISRRRFCWRAGEDRLGRNQRRAHPAKPFEGAHHGRGLRQGRAALRARRLTGL